MKNPAMKLLAALFLFLSIQMNPLPAQGADRWADNGDGTVTDSKTGLMWQKQDSYHDLKKAVSWYDALDYSERKNGEKYAGHSDWRLPTLTELHEIWDPARALETRDKEKIGLPAVFAGGGSYYLWTGDERGLDMAWYFGLGQKEDYFNLKEASDLGQGVRLVRKGK